MKFSNLRAAFVAVVVMLLSACGGGGGGGDDSPHVSAASGPSPSSGSSTPAVTGSVVGALQGTTVAASSLGAIDITFSGALDPSSVSASYLQGGTLPSVAGVIVLSAGNTKVTVTPKIRLAFGQQVTLVVTAKDTIGRTVTTSVSFATSAMSCVSPIWSNPATFNTALQDCVAPIGVQALVTPGLNTMQDDSCVFTVGVPMTPQCKLIAANGTLLFVDTSIVVNGHSVIWAAFIGTDGKSRIVLFDMNDPNNPVPLGTMVLPNSLLWEIGNPSGESISLNTGVVGNETDLVTWDVATNALKRTCLVRCPAP